MPKEKGKRQDNKERERASDGDRSVAVTRGRWTAVPRERECQAKGSKRDAHERKERKKERH